MRFRFLSVQLLITLFISSTLYASTGHADGISGGELWSVLIVLLILFFVPLSKDRIKAPALIQKSRRKNDPRAK